ncbi:NETI motif-containing protein [Lederbergia citrea]|uniref:NETI motif-containing protein n=1 Tax=Lederbergia citrea TaxID=2833581 RepID=A0A942UUZ3_9BACI|nr:NETI motif-containing protein [Lederbergia citrea]MBS4179479.1 NETI motif-containing protein [Lederbergia citrea]MBS4206147.1 NETI motif-containing protein [Lederbergia citrea]MBS4224404.1 NETI motif-containing protein [Lederbergia citrea]
MKKEFEVMENETIDDCLKRMELEGFKPVRRIEKPLFKEEQNKGETKYIPIAQKIIFQGVKTP